VRAFLALVAVLAAVPVATATPRPGSLPQTTAVPSASTRAFRARMAALWRGVVRDSTAAALPAFFPVEAYRQVKDEANPAADWRDRLVHGLSLDLHAVHVLLGADAGRARLVGVSVPRQWAWIPPGGCYNRVGYWHAPGSRLLYRVGGRLRSVGVYSLISWRGEWYVVHLGVWDRPGVAVEPADGAGTFGPPGGC
jgi:hypothetical protein